MSQQASEIVADPKSKASSQAPSTTPVSYEDAALVERVKQGDMQAYGQLVRKYQDRIYNLILRMCGRAADAEELAQEAFMKALERIAQFRGHSQFYTWLFRIAANLTISFRRRRGRVRFHSLSSGPDDGDGLEGMLTAPISSQRNPSPESAALRAEMGERIMAALDDLDDDFRMVVVLRDVEEMDYAGIAEVLDVPVGTIKSRLHRARSLLKEKLADLI